MTTPTNPLPEFYRLIYLAAETAEAVDALDGVDVELTAAQAVAAANLINYCTQHSATVAMALLRSIVHADEATP